MYVSNFLIFYFFLLPRVLIFPIFLFFPFFRTFFSSSVFFLACSLPILTFRAVYRRLLDGLWMSAKRGSGTLSLSVADGRTLIAGLMAPGAAGEAAGVSLGVPLARPTSNSRSSSGSCKPVRPIVGGASGPFARAARESLAGDRGRKRR